MTQRFLDRVVIITGASRGIGAASAVAFAAEGAQVAINYRADAAGARETLQRIQAAGGKAITVQADVSNTTEVERLVSAVESELGPVDVLVNNAARINRDPFLALTLDEFDRVWATNVRGVFYLSQLCARRMVERRQGCIIHLSSILARQTIENRTAYATSKGALESLTRAMALDLAPFGVRVNCVAPGLIRTEALLSGMPTAEAQQAMQRYIPAGRFGEPRELADVIIWLASDAASYVNGVVIAVDAGLGVREAKPI